MKNAAAMLVAWLACAAMIHAQAPGKPPRVSNPDFAEGDGLAVPAAWILRQGAFTDPRGKASEAVEGVIARTVREGGKAFVRMTFENNRTGKLIQIVELPARAKEAEFSASVRGRRSGGAGRPVGGFRFFTKDGTFLPDPRQMSSPGELSPRSWEKIALSCAVPQGATICCVIVGGEGPLVGTFDFRDVDVRFR